MSSSAAPFTGLKVALVHDWLTGMRGGEKVLEAIAELFPTAPIYTLFHFKGAVSETLERREIHTSYLQNRWTEKRLRASYRHFLPLFPSAIEDFDLTGYDLIVSTSHCVAKGVVPGPDTFHACYCHSPIRYAWDQEHQYFPERRGLVARTRNLLISRLRLWDVASCPRVDHFWANSSFVARRIRRFYGRDAEVLHPPVAVQDFQADEKDARNATEACKLEPEPYCLAVSALVPYKKLDLAIQACELADIELRIVGTGPELRRLAKMAGPKTRLLGRVGDRELQRLYRDAACFLQPGIEDFGIATVEALAAGTPVVAVAKGGVLDIVEDGLHGALYEGFEPRDICAAIDKSLQIRFNPLKLAERAGRFSQARFTAQLKQSLARRLAEREGDGSRQIMERT